MDTTEFTEAFGTMPATLLITVIIASAVRSWKFKGIARYFSASTAFLFLGLLMQLYITPFGVLATFVIVGVAILFWAISLFLTKGWYLLIEIAVMPVLNIVGLLFTGPS